MKIALISLDQKWEDKPHNLARCIDIVARAAQLGAELVIFPEMTLTGFTMNAKSIAESFDDSASLRSFSEISKENGLWIIAGIVFTAGEKSENTLVAFSPKGIVEARYTKIHPFSFAGEDQYFCPGRDLSKVQLPEFNVGLSICYDLRFPELYSALAKDCEAIINIANWPKRRVKHWRALLKARAIENQIYVIGVNRIGVDGNQLEYEHSSLIVNANGEFIDPIVLDGELGIYLMSRQILDDFRRGFSTRQDRLPELYRQLI